MYMKGVYIYIHICKYVSTLCIYLFALNFSHNYLKTFKLSSLICKHHFYNKLTYLFLCFTTLIIRCLEYRKKLRESRRKRDKVKRVKVKKSLVVNFV